MPFKKKYKTVSFYVIYQRQRMGIDAQTTNLTNESIVINCKPFLFLKEAVIWIKKQRNHGLIFIIRDQKKQMINSYGWKKNKLEWGVINRDGYFGGYKIGNPDDQNGPSRSQCNECSKPSCSKPHI